MSILRKGKCATELEYTHAIWDFLQFHKVMHCKAQIQNWLLLKKKLLGKINPNLGEIF